mgnify:CR=1 FL=1
MKAIAVVSITVALAVLAAFGSRAGAKTQVFVSPTSGAPGSVVRVEGSGFCDGPVDIIATAPDAIPAATGGGLFADGRLPAHIPLANVAAVANGFVEQITLPDTDALTDLTGASPLGSIDILVVQAGNAGCIEPNKAFIAGQRVALVASDLPLTGDGSGGDAKTRGVWLIAAAAVLIGIPAASLSRRRDHAEPVESRR